MIELDLIMFHAQELYFHKDLKIDTHTILQLQGNFMKKILHQSPSVSIHYPNQLTVALSLSHI